MQDDITNVNNKTMSSSSSAASGQPTKVSKLRNLSGSATKRLYFPMPIMALTSDEKYNREPSYRNRDPIDIFVN